MDSEPETAGDDVSPKEMQLLQQILQDVGRTSTKVDGVRESLTNRVDALSGKVEEVRVQVADTRGALRTVAVRVDQVQKDVTKSVHEHEAHRARTLKRLAQYDLLVANMKGRWWGILLAVSIGWAVGASIFAPLLSSVFGGVHTQQDRVDGPNRK